MQPRSENPRTDYGTDISLAPAFRPRQLHDETKSCGKQPANIRVNNRRVSGCLSVYTLEAYCKKQTAKTGVEGLLFSIDCWQTYQPVHIKKMGASKNKSPRLSSTGSSKYISATLAHPPAPGQAETIRSSPRWGANLNFSIKVDISRTAVILKTTKCYGVLRSRQLLRRTLEYQVLCV